jgi:hypothetical protein
METEARIAEVSLYFNWGLCLRVEG